MHLNSNPEKRIRWTQPDVERAVQPAGQSSSWIALLDFPGVAGDSFEKTFFTKEPSLIWSMPLNDQFWGWLFQRRFSRFVKILLCGAGSQLPTHLQHVQVLFKYETEYSVRQSSLCWPRMHFVCHRQRASSKGWFASSRAQGEWNKGWFTIDLLSILPFDTVGCFMGPGSAISKMKVTSFPHVEKSPRWTHQPTTKMTTSKYDEYDWTWWKIVGSILFYDILIFQAVLIAN